MIYTKRNKVNSVIVTFAMIIAIFLALHLNSFAEVTPQIHVIEIRDLEFIPEVIHVKLGDSVQWVNNDFIAHTATAKIKSWNSNLIDVNTSWQMTIDRETIGDYFCEYHPNMEGKIKIVNETSSHSKSTSHTLSAPSVK